MYRYPNGMECDASPLRVGLYEAIVPPVAMTLAFGGLAVIVKIVLAQQWGFLASFNAIAWSWTAWVALVAIGAAALHDVWCRPIHGDGEGLFGPRRRRPEVLPSAKPVRPADTDLTD